MTITELIEKLQYFLQNKGNVEIDSDVTIRMYRGKLLIYDKSDHKTISELKKFKSSLERKAELAYIHDIFFNHL